MYSDAKKHFKKHDPKLYAASLEIDLDERAPSNDLYRDILWTIVGQQLSSRAADTIFERFRALLPKGSLTPKKVLALTHEQMRASGLSGAKARAVHAVSKAVQDGTLVLANASTLSDDEIRAVLTKVKGIGPWTAEMILMFSLARPDVFSRGDLGLKKGLMVLYSLKKPPSEAWLERTVRAWSPYRTYASRILWKLADRKSARIARKRPR